jgi:hypothetical protein
VTNILDLSAALRDELAANDRPALIDPRSVPLRFSSMKLVQQSPLHYWWAVQHGYDETLSMRLGTGAHAMLFGTPYVVWSGRRQGKAWEAFEAVHTADNAAILTQSEYEKSRAMADAIKAHPTAARLLFTNTQLEQRIDWEWQGRAFRSTPDAASRTACVDLKCLRSAEPDAVKWQSAKMGYHIQAAVYRRALNQTGLHNIKDNYLVVVENKQPHPVTVLRFTETALEAGDRIAASMLEQVLACEANNTYPGYTTKIEELELPMTADDFIFDDNDEQDEELPL